MQTLQDKVAVVTGAASGIGKALAERFGRAGMAVAMADVEEPVLAAAVEEVGASAPRVIGVPTDVADPGAMANLAERTRDELGGTHVVCLNAGVSGPAAPVELLTEDDWAWTLGVNLWGVIHGLRAFLPGLLAQDEGHVVMTASMAGLIGGVGTPYNVSKAGVVALAESTYWRLRATGSQVGVSVLCPGLVATNIRSSDRNRPERHAHTAVYDLSPDEVAVRDAFEALLAAGTRPAVVADLVHDAVLNERFYVYTDERFWPMLRLRHECIEEGRNPERPDLSALREAGG